MRSARGAAKRLVRHYDLATVSESTRVGLSPRNMVAAAQAGDAEALRALVEHYQDTVFRFGWRLCRSEADAKDVLQETLLTALEKLDTFRGEASFSSWLYAIARSMCARRRRNAARSVELADDTPLSGHVAADEAASREQLRALLHGGLDQIPAKYREVLFVARHGGAVDAGGR